MIFKEFFKAFNKGFDAYISGDWNKAKDILSQIEEIKGMGDYPTQNILEVMKEYNFKSPSNWRGYRELTEK